MKCKFCDGKIKGKACGKCLMPIDVTEEERNDKQWIKDMRKE